MLFAQLKRILKLDRLRLRGLQGAKDELACCSATSTAVLYFFRIRRGRRGPLIAPAKNVMLKMRIRGLS